MLGDIEVRRILLLICLMIFSAWTIRLDYKIFDRKLKRYILSMGGLLIFLIAMRIVRIYESSYFVWYLYYVALIFVPAFYYLCSRYLSGQDNRFISYTVFTISTILLVMVLTNDLHGVVFRINEAAKLAGKSDYYEQNIGYYMIAGWMIYLFLAATVTLVIKRRRYKRDVKILIPFVPIILGIIYTAIYINVPAIQGPIDMSLTISLLVFVGMEGLFVMDLIPNNVDYDEIFTRSLLPIAILSPDGKILYRTQNEIDIPEIILRDIREDSASSHYVTRSNEHHKYEVEKLKSGYAVIMTDYTNIDEAKEELYHLNNRLRRQEKLLSRHRSLKEKLYEVKVNNEIMENLSHRIDKKKLRINELMDGMDEPEREALYEVKYLIAYCKRMSNLIVSNYNYEIYDKDRIATVLGELIEDSRDRGIYGQVNISKRLMLDSIKVTSIYEVLFAVFSHVRDVGVLINLSKDGLDISFDSKVDAITQALTDDIDKEAVTLDEKDTEDGTILRIRFAG